MRHFTLQAHVAWNPLWRAKLETGIDEVGEGGVDVGLANAAEICADHLDVLLRRRYAGSSACFEGFSPREIGVHAGDLAVVHLTVDGQAAMSLRSLERRV
ncbi:MAG TPA: hypothetical protein VIM22_07380 [Solirubrobacteraceae bacterium]|jgi:hypothetical protein